MEMITEPPLLGSKKIQVGQDQVTLSDKLVTIDARHPFPDWQIREFRRNPILFQDGQYYVLRKEPVAEPYAIRYVLTPWDASCAGGMGHEYVYDAEAVAERDKAVRMEHYELAIRSFLLVFYPLLGLLWSRTKEKLNRFCFVPKTITGVSITFAFGLVVLDGIFAKMLMVGGARSGQLALGGIVRAFCGQDYLSLGICQISVFWLDVVLFMLMICDCVIRYGQHMGDSQHPWGFLEWSKYLLPRKFRPKE